MDNIGFKSFNFTNRKESENRQYIIIGINRGGTSAIAGALDQLGIKLGSTYSTPNFEDQKLADAFRKKDWKHFKSIIKTYEITYKNFAWKLPNSHTQLKRIIRYFSNPSLIIVYRDIFAIANRQHLVYDSDIFNNMNNALISYLKIIKLIKKQKLPFFCISYEKMLLNPYSFSKELAIFCDIKASNRLLNKVSQNIKPSPKNYIAWSSISRLNQLNYDGCIDTIDENSISGWMVQKESDIAVEIEVFVNNHLIIVKKCNLYREDLINAGKSKHGNAGFFISLNNKLIEGDTILIRPKNTLVGLIKIFE